MRYPLPRLLRTSLSGGPVPAWRVLTAVLVLAVAGCASSAGGPTESTGGSPNRLVRADLNAVPQAGTAFQVVQLLRPAWLRTRSSSLVSQSASAEVLVDGMRMPNGLESLRSMPTDGIEMMEFLSAADATTRYGTGFPAGAILINMQRR